MHPETFIFLAEERRRSLIADAAAVCFGRRLRPRWARWLPRRSDAA